MAGASVPSLLKAVRHHLWREQLAAAMRRTAWGSAALAALAVLLQLGIGRGGVPALAAAALLGSALLTRALATPPPDSACALWADRRLEGASAFTTWLELHDRTSAPSGAVRWLEQWAAARAADALQQLAVEPAPLRLGRPLLAAGVALALAAFVLLRPAPVAADIEPPAAASVAKPALPAAETVALAPAPVNAANDLAAALRSAQRREAAAPAGGRDRPAGAGEGRAGAAASAPDTLAPANGKSPSGASSVTDNRTPNAGSTGSAGVGTGGGTGREAGAQRDELGGQPSSSDPIRALAVQRSVLPAPSAAIERQADRDRAGSFSDGPVTAARPGHAAFEAPPAQPPPADDAPRLTISQASYVQAWMKAQRTPR